MITPSRNKREILDYIGADYARCLYLYIDFCVYGQSDNPNVAVYVDKNPDGAIRAVALSYYTSLHIYSKSEDYDSAELLSLIDRHQPTTVFAVAPMIRTLAERLEDYALSVGTVGRLTEPSPIEIREHVVRLERAMLPAVADLLIDGQNYAGRYKGKQTYLRQLIERSDAGMGRHYAMLDENGMIVAHAATYAEYGRIAVASGIYTLPSQRRKGYAQQTYAALCDDLVAENKEVFAYYWSENTAQMHHKIGFKDVCEWGELKKE